eukprot:13398834-Alexandrium_andersonii.AAC.1
MRRLRGLAAPGHQSYDPSAEELYCIRSLKSGARHRGPCRACRSANSAVLEFAVPGSQCYEVCRTANPPER